MLERNPVLPAELGHIVRKALEKDRKLRYQSAAELRADLERLKRDSSADRKPGAISAHVVARRRFRITWLAIAGSVLLIIAAVIAAFLLRRPSDRTLRELVPVRVTSNGSDAPVETLALSPDGKYLAYSDKNGVHVRSVQTSDSRVLPDTKGMQVQYWAADGTQFFLAKPANQQYTFYSVSLAGGAMHPLGNALPSPGGQYSEVRSYAGPFIFHLEVRRVTDGKVYVPDHKDAVTFEYSWSPHDRRLAVIFGKSGGAAPFWIEALDPENGHWTNIIAPQPDWINGIAWLSDRELVYAKFESASSTDSNLWVVKIDPSTGIPSGPARRRTQWTDYAVGGLSATADGTRMCFTRYRSQGNVYIGDLQAHGTRLASLRQLTSEDAWNIPETWTPDSRAVLFGSNRDGQSHIYKQDIDKDTADRITSGPGDWLYPRISPDGQWLLYCDKTGHSKNRVMRMPLAGGTAQEIFAADSATGDSAIDISCSDMAGGACILNEHKGNVLITSLFDPMKGRGPKILETKLGAEGQVTVGPAISPDGRRIAFVLPRKPKNRIRVVDLHGIPEQEITVSGAEELQPLEWSANGAGFFSGDISASTISTRLLYIERNGASHVLWTQPFGIFLFWEFHRQTVDILPHSRAT